MYGFTNETGHKNHKRFDTGIEPLSDGLGSRHIYGSPFRDINHGGMRAEPA